MQFANVMLFPETLVDHFNNQIPNSDESLVINIQYKLTMALHTCSSLLKDGPLVPKPLLDLPSLTCVIFLWRPQSALRRGGCGPGSVS